MAYKYTKHHLLSGEEYNTIDQGLIDHSKDFFDFDSSLNFAFLVRDENNAIIGGCYGVSFYNALHLEQIWVDKLHRGQGIGSNLVRLAEEIAKERGYPLMTLNTMSWEAPEFYAKLGFKQCGVIDGYVNGAKRYMFSKRI